MNSAFSREIRDIIARTVLKASELFPDARPRTIVSEATVHIRKALAEAERLYPGDKKSQLEYVAACAEDAIRLNRLGAAAVH
jgi:hypothetical protein